MGFVPSNRQDRLRMLLSLGNASRGTYEAEHRAINYQANERVWRHSRGRRREVKIGLTSVGIYMKQRILRIYI